MIALIDGDVVAYMAAFAAQRNIYFIDVFRDGEAVEEFEFTSKEEAMELKEYLENKGGYLDCNLVLRKEVKAESAKHATICARQIIMKILGGTQATNYKLFITANDKSNFRYKIAKTKPYKGNRKAEKPVHYEHVRNYLHLVWDGYAVVGEEADDYLGIEQCRDFAQHIDQPPKMDEFGFRKSACNTIICSIDKDLKMIPGFHYDIKTGVTMFVTAEEAMRFFWKQMLMGDVVDNIVGIPRIGKVKAENIIESCETIEDCRKAVQAAYVKYYKQEWKEKYIEMGNLLWIKREPNAIFEDLPIAVINEVSEPKQLEMEF